MSWDKSIRALGRTLQGFIPRLAADFPGWDFGTQQTRDGLALVAVRRNEADEPGVCAVITDDPGEMRRTLGGNP
jgi:hypothetical protein